MGKQTEPKTKKQIWHTWNGDTTKDMEFIKDVTAIVFNDGCVLDMIKNSRYSREEFLWYHLESSITKIVAYTTDARASFESMFGEEYTDTVTTNNQ